MENPVQRQDGEEEEDKEIFIKELVLIIIVFFLCIPLQAAKKL